MLDSQVVVIKTGRSQPLASDQAPTPPQVAIAASGEGHAVSPDLVSRCGTRAQASVNGDALGKISHLNSDQRGESTGIQRLQTFPWLHAGRSAGGVDDHRHGACGADDRSERHGTDQRLFAR